MPARLVVIPTLYEAGSGPLIESMRYRVPVICSNVTSLPDTINNDAFTFAPLNIDEIAALIMKGIKDEDFRKRNLENSERRMQYFESKDYYKGFDDMYKSATGQFSKKHS